jgi:hypothetical protein
MDRLASLLAFLDGKTRWGVNFERFVISLILANVVSFLLSTDSDIDAQVHCDVTHNLDPGCVFDLVEVFTVAFFTVEYVARFMAIGAKCEPRPRGTTRPYAGFFGRLKWATTDFFSWVDLAAIVPFFVDRMISADLPALQFLRLFRIFHMLAREDRYLQAFKDLRDIFRSEHHALRPTANYSTGLRVYGSYGSTGLRVYEYPIYHTKSRK